MWSAALTCSVLKVVSAKLSLMGHLITTCRASESAREGGKRSVRGEPQHGHRWHQSHTRGTHGPHIAAANKVQSALEGV